MIFIVCFLSVNCSVVVSVRFEKSEYFGKEITDSEDKVEYALVVDGEFAVNFTVNVTTLDVTATGVLWLPW